jgi:hypothetical protein
MSKEIFFFKNDNQYFTFPAPDYRQRQTVSAAAYMRRSKAGLPDRIFSDQNPQFW